MTGSKKQPKVELELNEEEKQITYDGLFLSLFSTD